MNNATFNHLQSAAAICDKNLMGPSANSSHRCSDTAAMAIRKVFGLGCHNLGHSKSIALKPKAGRSNITIARLTKLRTNLGYHERNERSLI